MIIKTTGIVLRQDPFSKTSQIVSWLTPDHGRVATVAKGAKRKKNNLLGQYDCFYTCEFLFYQTHRSSLHILKECSPITPRTGFRVDWRATVGASYLCDLLNRLTPSGGAHTHLFDWANSTLDFLAKQGATETVLNWAELKLLELLGVAPKLSGCLGCGTTTLPANRPVSFSISRGGIICATCRKTAEDLIISVPLDVLSMLRGWESAATPLMAKRTNCTTAQAKTANRLLGTFIHYHLESCRSRDITMGLV